MDYCDEAVKRHSLVGDKRQRFHLYTRSLDGRLREVNQVHEELVGMYHAPPVVSTALLDDPHAQMTLRCTIFWALAYSVFDIVANAANVVHGVVPDERHVSFKGVTAQTWSPAATFLSDATRVRQRRYFERLDALRNCVLHRRSVHIEMHDIAVNAAYTAYDSTSGERAARQWLICDDPYARVPTTTKRIELGKDNDKILRGIGEDIIKLVRNI